MKKFVPLIKKYKTTAFLIIPCCILLYFTHNHRLQVFEPFAELMEELDRYQIDEIVVVLLIFFIAFFIDVLRISNKRRRTEEIQQQRLRVLKATMTSVQDIMNNFLNNLVLVRMRAEQKNEFSRESAQLMNEIIRDASEKIKRLGDLDDTPEKVFAKDIVAIDYERKSTDRS